MIRVMPKTIGRQKRGKGKGEKDERLKIKEKKELHVPDTCSLFK